MNKPPVFRPHSPADVSLYIEDKKPRRGISCEDDYSGFGRLAFTDPDAGDTHRVSVAFKPTSGASSLLGALSARVRRDGAHGRVGWRFSIDRDAVAFLGAGETYSEIFTISLADSAGNIARQDVAVTLIGANDAPRIFWRAGDVFERRLTETSGSPSPGALLSAGGATLGDVAYNMIFIKRVEDYTTLNEVYAEYFGKNPPARYCIVTELVREEFLVEISSIAHVGPA